MKFCRISNGVIIEKNRDLPQNFGNISNFNQLSILELKELGWFPYVYVETKTENNVLISKNVEILENEVVETEICRNLTQQELQEKNLLVERNKWEEIRKKRNRLLKESDWTQLEDSPINKVDWVIYRNQLRQIPQSFSNPDSVEWPTPPNF